MSGLPWSRHSSIEAILGSIDEQIRGESLEAVVAALHAAKPKLFQCLRPQVKPDIAAKALVLKVLNLCLAKHHAFARSTHLLSRPYGLLVDPSNGCTLACPGCVHSHNSRELKLFDWKPGLLRDDTLASFFRRFGPYAVQVMFCNYGEPLLNPDTPRYVRRAKTYLAQTMISTSMSVDRFNAESYVECGLDYIIASIDGATQGVYEKFRRRGNLDLVKSNVVKLVEAKRKLRSRTPLLCWQFLAFEHNVHELPKAIEMARTLGMDEFRIARPFSVSWDDPSFRPAEVERQTIIFHNHSAKSMRDNWNSHPDELSTDTIEAAFDKDFAPRQEHAAGEGHRDNGQQTCRWLYKNIVMDANGRVLPCCGAPKPEGDLVYAHLNGADPFNSPRYQRARTFFADRAAYERSRQADTMEPYCTRCEWTDCQADIDAAEVANYLLTAGPGLFSARSVDILSSW